MKKFDSFKECIINTPTKQFADNFSSDWSYKEILSYMLESYPIDKESITSVKMSNVTLYKISK